MIDIVVFNNHRLDAIAGGPKVSGNIYKPRSQTCLTPNCIILDLSKFAVLQNAEASLGTLHIVTPLVDGYDFYFQIIFWF